MYEHAWQPALDQAYSNEWQCVRTGSRPVQANTEPGHLSLHQPAGVLFCGDTLFYSDAWQDVTVRADLYWLLWSPMLNFHAPCYSGVSCYAAAWQSKEWGANLYWPMRSAMSISACRERPVKLIASPAPSGAMSAMKPASSS